MSAPLLTVEQVAAILAVRPALVRQLAHRGDLSYLRIGTKLLRFRQTDVDVYIAGRVIAPRRARAVRA